MNPDWEWGDQYPGQQRRERERESLQDSYDAQDDRAPAGLGIFWLFIGAYFLIRPIFLQIMVLWSLYAFLQAPWWFQLVFGALNASTLYLCYTVRRHRGQAAERGIPLHVITLFGSGMATELARWCWFDNERRKQFKLSIFVGCVVLIGCANAVEPVRHRSTPAPTPTAPGQQHGHHSKAAKVRPEKIGA